MPISVPSWFRQTWRYLPPTRRSISHTGIDQPGGPSSQRRTSSGWCGIPYQLSWRIECSRDDDLSLAVGDDLEAVLHRQTPSTIGGATIAFCRPHFLQQLVEPL